VDDAVLDNKACPRDEVPARISKAPRSGECRSLSRVYFIKLRSELCLTVRCVSTFHETVFLLNSLRRRQKLWSYNVKIHSCLSLAYSHMNIRHIMNKWQIYRLVSNVADSNKDKGIFFSLFSKRMQTANTEITQDVYHDTLVQHSKCRLHRVPSNASYSADLQFSVCVSNASLTRVGCRSAVYTKLRSQ
jgi:hypothetical protein